MKGKKAVSDKPLAVILFALGAAMYYFSFFFRESRYVFFGSRTETLPRICAGFIIVFSVLLFIQSALRERQQSKEEISTILDQLKEDKPVYIMFSFTALYIFLFTRFGFMTSTFVYTVAATFLLGRGRIRWYGILIIALGISVGSYLFFVVLLNVYVPRGILI